ncbi:MAG: SusC/RagA family TonB-linked outer membrane protein, partial [Flavobacteriaceae bacterium]
WKTTFGPDIRYKRRGIFTGSLTNANRGGPGKATVQNTQNFGFTLENLLTYSKAITDNQNLKVTLLQSVQQNRQEYFAAGVANIPYESQSFYNLGSASVKGDIVSSLRESSLSSFMGRLNYEIGGKYLFQASLRADGSSVLADGNKWNYFPGASAGWRISKEDFMADSNTFSELKLRASYGEVGNASVDPYQTAGRLSKSVYAYGETSALGFRLNEIPNPELGWEVSKTVDIGLDYGLFNNRISGSFDWFSTKTSDILLESALPPTSGYSFILENIGSTQTSGLEFNVNAAIVDNNDGGFTWDLGFNIAGYKEEITALNLRDADGNPVDDVGNRRFIGEPIRVFYDYEKIGIYQADEEALATSAENKEPGEIKLKDQNGDGVITSDDRVILGTDTPDFYGGITNSFTYKNLDFSFFFYFRQGQTIFSSFHSSNNSLFGRYNNLDTDYWTIDNPTNVSPRPNENQERPRNSSTMSYFDGSYIKLRNVSLGYNFPKSITEKLGMSRLRLYVSGQNLFAITNYETFDPEVSEDEGNLDSGVVPSNRMFSMGLNVTF